VACNVIIAAQKQTKENNLEPLQSFTQIRIATKKPSIELPVIPTQSYFGDNFSIHQARVFFIFFFLCQGHSKPILKVNLRFFYCDAPPFQKLPLILNPLPNNRMHPTIRLCLQD